MPPGDLGEQSDFLEFPLGVHLGDLRETIGFPQVFVGCSLGGPQETPLDALRFSLGAPFRGGKKSTICLKVFVGGAKKLQEKSCEIRRGEKNA